MILEAERLGCVREVIVIAAALSLQDPRERPAEQQAQADQLHARFKDEGSRLPDLAEPLALPPGAAAGAVARSAFRRMCKRGVPQLPAGPRVAGLRVPAAPGLQGDEDRRSASPRDAPGRRRHPPGAALRPALAHRAARGAREGEGRRPAPGASTSAPAARGSRSSRAAGWPGSNPQFVMAGELVETSRGSGPGRTPRSSPSGPSGSARTW